MISINFTQLDDSIKTFILSVAVGSDVIIEERFTSVLDRVGKEIFKGEV